MQRTKGGILIPQRKGIPCGYCFRMIYREQEPKGQVVLVKDEPMCATCRAFKLSPLKDKILGDRKKHDKDKVQMEKLQERNEEQRIAEIAAISVEKSHTENTRVREQKGIK